MKQFLWSCVYRFKSQNHNQGPVMRTLPASIRIALLAVAGGLLAATPVRADRHPDVGVSVGFRVPHGYVDVTVGREHFYHYRGTFYRRGPHDRLVVVRAPYGAVIRELPPHCVRFTIGPSIYFRFGDVFYRQVPAGYMVIAAPMGAPVPPPPRAGQEFLSVWAGPNECLFRDGQFFQRTPEGLIWMEVPYGAMARTPPPEAVAVWVQGVKYLQSDDVYFRETPQGFQVVPAPFPPK